MAARLLLEDKINIIKTYYSTQNFREVHRRWPSFSAEPKPTVANIRNVVVKFEATGSVENVKQPGRPVSANTPELQAAIAESVARSPQKSTRRLSTELKTSHMTILRALQQLDYRPFRPRLLHGLLEDDPYQRVEFCEHYQALVNEDDSFQDRIIWTDEANFKLNGHINRHNCVYWDAVNPHIIIEREVNSPGVMVWAGIWSEGVIGPFFFDGTCDGQSYLAMLNDQFWPSMGHIVEEQHLWYMHDGAPAHWSKQVRSWLDVKFPGRWIGRGGEIAWPPRSPDLTPPDFFLWGVIKDRVYARKARTIEELKTAIATEIAAVPSDLCQKVCRSVYTRTAKCIELGGTQTELF
jgi:hypothetical protein